MSEKTFDELKVEAKEFGIKITGNTKEALEEKIEEARAIRDEAIAKGEVPPTLEKKESIKSDKPATTKFNAIVVSNGNQEIRTYSKKIHGSKFALLAATFANDRGYSMKMIDTDNNIVCPSCGHSFEPKA